MTALLTLAVALSLGGLSDEVDDFLSFQSRQGLSVQAVRLLELELLEPCSLPVPPFRRGFEGYLAAFGGNHTLDLWISIADSSWAILDTLPDDVPVLQMDGKQLMEADLVVLEALDMTHGATCDSAAVIWLLRPVDRGSDGVNL